jgi:drug/metabolite transporter (DMT)-like permease
MAAAYGRRSDVVTSERTDRVALAAFLACGVFAGGNLVGVVFSNKELAALWGAGLRFGLAAIILAGLAAGLRLRLPVGRALVGAVLFGVLNFAGAFGFAYHALRYLPAGLGSTLLALVPLATLLLAILHRQERLRTLAVAGGLLAVAGVALISNVSLAGSVPPLALLAGLGGVLCFAEAAVLVRRFPPVHPVVMNAVGMAVGAGVLLAGSLVAGDRWVLPQQGQTWAALGYLVVVGSIGVFLLYLVVLRRWAASRAAYAYLLIPPVAVVLSAWLDGERITVGLVLGGMLILAGVYVGAVRAGRRTGLESPGSARDHRRSAAVTAGS